MIYSPDQLIDAGYWCENFAYQIGGGEDENDMQIFTDGDIAIRIDYDRDSYPSGICYQCDYDSINYVNGWDYDNELIFEL